MSFLDDLKHNVDNYVDHLALEDIEYRVKLILREREELKDWKDSELKIALKAFQEDYAKGKPLDTMLVSAFAIVNESARRVLKQSPFPMQILAALVIHSGRVAEMKAGEGKTLTETMPVYLNALTGKGVHIVTTNDYLAERDAKLNGKLYNFLGLSVGYVTSTMKSDGRRKAYHSDITYVTNQEVGFDFLRDNLVFARADRVLRKDHPLNFGIVDEIDSILIDESRTPLIIAEPIKEERNYYDKFTGVVNQLIEDTDFEVDYKNKNVAMTDAGLNHVEQILGSPVFSKDNPMSVFYLDVCLRARILFEKDRDYIVSDGGVEIVDEFTGRVLPGRRFTDGVHQAIEAKEKVKIKESDKTQATITFQNFFPMYEKLSGMSGTVMQAREEFNKVYKLDVIQIPTNKPLIRVDHNDLFFKTQKGKFMGMMKKIRQIHKRNQPVLVAARNVETAHLVAQMLEDENLPHQLLTASEQRSEAEKISHAGESSMITVATNMAGRGTDILLGPGVAQLGGLYVIGTERHESRRIDDQLIGRAGRQGDPGESQFLISMEDEIMQRFGSEKIIDVMEAYDIPEDEYISGESLNKAFKKAQDFIESKNYDSRIYLYKYDRVVNFQRNQVYALRDKMVENPEQFDLFVKESVNDVVKQIFSLRDFKLISQQFQEIFSIIVKPEELQSAIGTKWPAPADVETKFIDYIIAATELLKTKPDIYQATQQLILQNIDNSWSSHLELMEVLKEEANLFSYASVDPLIDFIKESNKLFEQMSLEIERQFLKTVFLYLEQHAMLE